MAQLNQDLAALGKESAAAGWVQATYITADTQLLNARADERLLDYLGKAVKQARRFDGVPMDAATARAIQLLKRSDGTAAPAPDDAARRAELTAVMATRRRPTARASTA